jgi:hypothetical protein
MVHPVLTLALALALAAGTCPAEASGTTQPTRAVSSWSSAPDDAAVTSLSLSPQVVRASGTATVPVTVEFAFRQTSTAPVPATPTRVILKPVSLPGPIPIPPILSIVTPQASGTSTDGVWRGTIPVPSSAAGLWRVECVMLPVRNGDPPARCLTPPQRPTLRVIGTHVPSLSVRVLPSPIPVTGRTVVSGRLVDSQTGRAFAVRGIVVSTHRQICVFEAMSCSGEGLNGAFTDTQGRFSITIETNQSPRLCVRATIPGTHSADSDAPTLATDCRSLRHVVQLTAAAASTRVRIDRAVTVSGRVLPRPPTGRSSLASAAVIQLQRLTNGVWRTVGSAAVAADGTHRLSARADARGGTRGLQRYRVVLNQTTRATRVVSATLRITAT